MGLADKKAVSLLTQGENHESQNQFTCWLGRCRRTKTQKLCRCSDSCCIQLCTWFNPLRGLLIAGQSPPPLLKKFEWDLLFEQRCHFAHGHNERKK
jgi:hypothetical protein